MKGIFFFCLVALAFAEELHPYRHKGHLVHNGEPQVAVSGQIYIELLKTVNITTIAGMCESDHQHVPFAFVGKMTKFVKDGDKIEIEADCWEGGWGTKIMHDMVGKIKVTGSWQRIEYYSNCSHPQDKLDIQVKTIGTKEDCPFYPPAEAARRAHILLGESEEAYKPVNVINYAILGYPYIAELHNCSAWLKDFKSVPNPLPGYAIVGKDGLHCGIIDKEGDKFIHSNPAKHVVTMTPMSMTKDFFKNGYVIKECKC